MLGKPSTEKLSLDFTVVFIKIKVSTKPELVHSSKLVLNYLFLLQNVCVRSKKNFLGIFQYDAYLYGNMVLQSENYKM